MTSMKSWRRIAAAILLAMLLHNPGASAVTLDECITASLRSNPDVRAATERVQAARAAIKEAQSAYYPVLFGSAAYALTDNPPQAFMMLLNQRRVSMDSDFNNPSDTDNLALSLGVKYRLFDFGRRGLDNEMARGGAEVSRLVLRGLQNDLIHQVTRGYYTLLQAGAFVTVQEESVKSLQESLRVASERLKAGGAVKTDVLNLEVQLAQAKEDLIRARNGVKLALAALNTAIGANLVDSANIPAKVEPQEIKLPESEDLSAIQNRPELLAAQKMAEIQQAALKKARHQYWPTVNAFGSADWNSAMSINFESSYIVGVAAEMDFFDGFRRSAAASGAGAQQRAAAAEEEKAANNLRLDLTSASIQASEACERRDVVRKSIENAEEALRITQQRYQQGAADLPELLTAQVGLTGTRTRNVAALYDYLTALSNLERARGQLVDSYAKGE
ncbi:MAG: TolC family protein [Kiritimatiellae bacterium]|nr:TolC family protein [Kiritimatiellia bacterium]